MLTLTLCKITFVVVICFVVFHSVDAGRNGGRPQAHRPRRHYTKPHLAKALQGNRVQHPRLRAIQNGIRSGRIKQLLPYTFIAKHGRKEFYLGAIHKVNFMQAAKVCNNRGMARININSAAENNALMQGLKSYFGVGEYQFWTSGHREPNNRWIWMNSGKPLTYKNWFVGQPDNVGKNEKCLEIRYKFRLPTMKWNNHVCTIPKFALCQAVRRSRPTKDKPKINILKPETEEEDEPKIEEVQPTVNQLDERKTVKIDVPKIGEKDAPKNEEKNSPEIEEDDDSKIDDTNMPQFEEEQQSMDEDCDEELNQYNYWDVPTSGGEDLLIDLRTSPNINNEIKVQSE